MFKVVAFGNYDPDQLSV